MHTDSALITFVLDESGSMGHIAQAARDGFNDYLKEQIAHGSQTSFWTLVTFNNRPSTRFAVIPAAEVRPLRDDYTPGGMTALYDALGSVVTDTKAYLETLGTKRPSDVIVVILTDGLENVSQQWTAQQVFDLISEAEKAGWQFIFLGANQDSWSVAQNLGIRKGTVVDWAPDAVSHKRAMAEASDATTDYRNLKEQQTRYRDRRTK